MRHHGRDPKVCAPAGGALVCVTNDEAGGLSSTVAPCARPFAMNPLRPSSASSRHKRGPVNAAPRASRAAQHALLFNDVTRSRSFWILAALLVAGGAAVALLLVFTGFDWTVVTRGIEHLDPLAILPLMALLPVGGFPIVVIYLVAGARFGPLWGGVVVAAVTACHLLLTHAIARSFLRGPILRFVERRHRQLPEIPADEHAGVALIVALVPGLPYVVRNYLLALSGVRLRVYFWICLPVYVARSYVTILVGDLGSDPSGRRLLILFGVDVVKVAVCAYVIWRLREHHRRFHGGHEAHGGDDGRATAATPP
jgi:uncharacterized membrane protein YdjX (TVP38/TMEM64 family)